MSFVQRGFMDVQPCARSEPTLLTGMHRHRPFVTRIGKVNDLTVRAAVFVLYRLRCRRLGQTGLRRGNGWSELAFGALVASSAGTKAAEAHSNAVKRLTIIHTPTATTIGSSARADITTVALGGTGCCAGRSHHASSRRCVLGELKPRHQRRQSRRPPSCHRNLGPPCLRTQRAQATPSPSLQSRTAK